MELSTAVLVFAALLLVAVAMSGVIGGMSGVGGGALMVPTSLLTANDGVQLAHQLARQRLEVALGGSCQMWHRAFHGRLAPGRRAKTGWRSFAGRTLGVSHPQTPVGYLGQMKDERSRS